MAQMVKNPSAMQETWVRSLGQKIPWRREWQSTPVLLSGESQGQRSLEDDSSWGLKELDSMWTVNLQMFKLDLEKVEELEIKLPTSAGSSKKAREFQKNIYFCFIDYAKPLGVWITTTYKILQEMRIPDHVTCLLTNLYAGQEATIRTGHGTTVWF